MGHNDSFKPGEYLQLGSVKKLQFSYVDARNPSKEQTASGPIVARFVEEITPGRYKVRFTLRPELSHLDFDAPPYGPQLKWAQAQYQEVIVKKEDVMGFESGSREQEEKSLGVFNAINLTLESGERVRFRNSDGLMKSGTIISLSKDKAQIRSVEGDKSVDIKEIFKAVIGAGEPKTPEFRNSWIFGVPIDRPQGLELELLDSVAKISSHPDFAKLSPDRQIYEIAQFIHQNVRMATAALTGEALGLSQLDDFIAAGIGCCRHISAILGTALSETGYPIQIVVVQNEDAKGKSSHMWLEVKAPGKDASIDTFIVDDTYREPVVQEVSQFKKFAEQNPEWKDILEKFYFNPQRKYIPEPPKK